MDPPLAVAAKTQLDMAARNAQARHAVLDEFAKYVPR
jgi:hypothetical protein